MTKAEKEASPLIQGIVTPLEQRGLLAATLSAGPKKWQGVVRLPERHMDGSWGERSDRVKAVEVNQGLFRRMDLKSVIFVPLALLADYISCLQLSSLEIARSSDALAHG